MKQAKTPKIEIESRLVAAVENMPAFPNSVQRVLDLSNNINSPSRELVAVIEKDPVMTMKILKIINSAYYSLPNKITSVSQSVVYLGTNTIKNLALALAALGSLPKRNPINFNIQQYLIHSLVTGCLARELCSLLDTDLEPSDAYVAGLLHDFGKVVLAQFMTDEYQQIMELTVTQGIPLDKAEREILGVDHALVGAMLAQRWQFPYDLVQCIADHHKRHAHPTVLLDCVRVANQICKREKLGDGHNPFRKGEKLVTTVFGGSYESVLESLGDIQVYLDEATMFANISYS